MRRIIVTASDEGFMPLTAGLLRSLGRFDFGPSTHFGLLDVGLSPSTRDALASRLHHVMPAEWDLPVRADVRRAKPHLRAMTVRPFLPRYFPGYEQYLWLDADTWVQERYAVDLLFDASAGGAMALARQEHPAYDHARPTSVRWRTQRAEAYFGPGTLLRSPYLNTGVFALRGDAPHWQLWAERFRQGLAACDSAYVDDQTSLNHMLSVDGPPAAVLEAVANWTCHLALPAWDEAAACFREPVPPGRRIGILHLTSKTKDARLPDGRGLRFAGAALP